jgi:hypothetical protein
MRRALSFVLLSALAACGSSGPAVTLGEIEFTAPPGSAQPSLYALADGRVALTWLEPGRGDGHALRLAVRVGGTWGQPMTVTESASLLSNWADFPSFVETADGLWLIHWLEVVEGGDVAYHVRITSSTDEGRSWSAPVTPHRDASPTEHGFVSMVPWGSDAAALVWLDGRAMVPEADERVPHGDMSLRFTTVAREGVLGEETMLDARTCECCQTALVRTTSGLVAAHRDRSPDEVRDIAVVRYVDGRWTEPVYVADDGFVYPGCPVNGPQLAATGDTVVIAWYTAPEQQARVQVARSADGGVTWSDPVQVDLGDPLGRVDIELLPDGSAFVVWLERTAEAAVMGRWVDSMGAIGEPFLIAATTESRGSGFPRTARVGDTVFVAWRDMEGDGAVRVRTVGR